MSSPAQDCAPAWVFFIWMVLRARLSRGCMQTARQIDKACLYFCPTALLPSPPCPCSVPRSQAAQTSHPFLPKSGTLRWRPEIPENKRTCFFLLHIRKVGGEKMNFQCLESGPAQSKSTTDRQTLSLLLSHCASPLLLPCPCSVPQGHPRKPCSQLADKMCGGLSPTC